LQGFSTYRREELFGVEVVLLEMEKGNQDIDQVLLPSFLEEDIASLVVGSGVGLGVVEACVSLRTGNPL
jgi:hypothetical protein